MALAVEEVQNALFHTWAALFIGLPFLLVGWAGLLAVADIRAGLERSRSLADWARSWWVSRAFCSFRFPVHR